MRQVNLLPIENQRSEQWRVLRNSLCGIFLPLGFLMLVVHLLLGLQVAAMEKRLNSPLRHAESAPVVALQQAMADIKLKGEGFLKTDKEIVEYFIVQPSAANILGNIGNQALDKVWLTDLRGDGTKRVYEIVGRSFNIRLVSEFMLELKKLPYFENVELVTMGEGAKGKEGEIDFKMICHLK
jgi:Tfp pilus assembly protein PilN